MADEPLPAGDETRPGDQAGGESRPKEAAPARPSRASVFAAVLAGGLVVKLVAFHAAYVFPAAPRVLPAAMALVTDLCIVLGLATAALLVEGALHWNRRRLVLAVAAAVNVAVTALMVANAVHFRFFGRLIDLYQIGMAGMLPEVRSTAWGLVSPWDALYLADWGVVVGVAVRRRRPPGGPERGLVARISYLVSCAFRDTSREKRATSDERRGRLARSPVALPARALAACALVAAMVQLLWRPLSTPDAFTASDHFTQSSMLVYYAWHGAGRLLGVGRVPETVALRDEVCTCGGVAQASRPRSQTGWRPVPRPSFLLIQVESMNPEALTPAVMPRLCDFASRGIVFERFHSFAWCSLTFRAEYALHTGLYPPVARATYPSATLVQPEGGGLLRRLSAAGYETWFFFGFDGDSYMRRANYAAWGVDRFMSGDELKAMGLPAGRTYGAGPAGPGIEDEHMAPKVAELLQGARRPFFAQYLTLSSHFPYPIGRDRAIASGVAPPAVTTEAAYLRNMAYVDEHLGRLLDDLARRGLLENTCVFVYGDHRGRMETRLPFSEMRRRDAAWLGELVELHRVPCVLAGPGLAPAKVAMRASHVDLMPTVLELAGAAPSPSAMGRSMLRDCSCRVWVLPSLADIYVMDGPECVGYHGLRSGGTRYYARETGAEVEPPADVRARYEAVLSRARYSDAVFVRATNAPEGRSSSLASRISHPAASRMRTAK